ncbi:MAG: hypothetical protein IPN36_12635 [Bacteroidetes bacterium]|nr:hypothetical protein [Bacteroidota bacterium]
MLNQLKVKRLILYIHDERWYKMLAYGVPDGFLMEEMEERFVELNQLQFNNLQMPDWVQGFESIIPVFP